MYLGINISLRSNIYDLGHYARILYVCIIIVYKTLDVTCRPQFECEAPQFS